MENFNIYTYKYANVHNILVENKKILFSSMTTQCGIQQEHVKIIEIYCFFLAYSPYSKYISFSVVEKCSDMWQISSVKIGLETSEVLSKHQKAA